MVVSAVKGNPLPTESSLQFPGFRILRDIMKEQRMVLSRQLLSKSDSCFLIRIATGEEIWVTIMSKRDEERNKRNVS